MPAMHYTIRWPDATECVCYSPSMVMKDFFQPGQDYLLEDFLRRAREATALASDRVRAKFGFACSMAADQLLTIETRACEFAKTPGAQVHVVAFDTGAA